MEISGLNIKFLTGVGEKKAAILNTELGIQSYEEMLYHIPYKYIDRSKIYKIADLNPHLPYIQVKARIRDLKSLGAGKSLRMSATAYDETGELELIWFKGVKYLNSQIETEKEYLIFGQPSAFNRKLNIIHPEIDLFEKASHLLSGFQAVYPTTEKMKKAFLNSKAISKIQGAIFKNINGKIPETLPAWFIQKYRLLYLHEALYNVHFPESPETLRKALFRLKFEELFYIQLNILKLKYKRKIAFKGCPFPLIGDYFNTFYHQYLPFPLTNAQKRVIKEIRQDCGSGKQMNRLLQGDVGSGKTLVAVMCMLMALDNHYQTCLMAPTEILANQHFTTISEMLKDMGIRIALLTGSTKKKERTEIHQQLADGSLQIIMDFRNLEEGYQKINEYFLSKGYKTSMVHGKMKAVDKEEEMRLFVTGETQILVATTVIEVGVNVPNASLMVIESAERFGLSQLHQLRGRVGRGAEQSYCILMTSYKISNDSRKRIDTMVSTNDGFEIAEADLKLRGPGDIEGTQQSGLSCNLKVANLGKDALILNEASRIASSLLEEDPDLQKEENTVFATQIRRLFKTKIKWRYIS